MTTLTENPAVIAPMRALTPVQRDCLVSLHFYRNHFRRGGLWVIGPKQFNAATLASIEARGLARRDGREWKLTQGGRLALDRIKGART